MSNKALTKPVKQAVAIGLVAASTTKTGVKLVKQLRKLHIEVRRALLDHFKQEVPELVNPERIQELLTVRVLHPVEMGRAYVYGADGKNARCFGEYTWRRSGVLTTAALSIQEKMYTQAFNSWGGSGVLEKSSFHHTSPDLMLNRGFPDIPFAYTGGSYLHLVPEDSQKAVRYHSINKELAKLHDKIVDILKQLAELLQGTLVMLEEVEAALAPIKGTKQLVDLFPEALKHLPDGFYDPSPTQAVADPAAINEIRAKLAKGLPI